ncbi:hypothetical protein B0H11DRAFT_2335061 [Mycena galericulata]|nr:hypothetical protein B0H11DRAFT_2335061 [Mycena galericulata]
MHPSLRIQSISQLDSPVRELCTLAAKGSLKDLEQLRLIVMNSSSSYTVDYLPVFYRNLDPAKIPNIAELDEKIQDPDVSDTVTAAVLSLDALYFLYGTPLDLYPDLWPRVWKWTDFLDTYPYCNHTCSGEAQATSLGYFYYVARFWKNPQASCLIDSTPRVRIFIAKIWGIMVENEDYHYFEDLCKFIGRDEAVSDAEHLEEFVEGSGGTEADLASLVVKHITRTTPNLTGTDVCSKWLFQLDCCIRFAMAAHFGACYAKFNAVLMDHGIVKALIGAVLALEEATMEETADVLERCLILLERTTDISDSRSWVTEALDAGLIRAILSCTVHNCTPTSGTLEILRRLLADFLPGSLIYHSTVSGIVVSFKGARDLLQLPRFAESIIFPSWQKFRTLVNERLGMLSRFNSGEIISRRACDNLQCGAIHAKAHFMNGTTGNKATIATFALSIVKHVPVLDGQR